MQYVEKRCSYHLFDDEIIRRFNIYLTYFIFRWLTNEQPKVLPRKG